MTVSPVLGRVVKRSEEDAAVRSHAAEESMEEGSVPSGRRGSRGSSAVEDPHMWPSSAAVDGGAGAGGSSSNPASGAGTPTATTAGQARPAASTVPAPVLGLHSEDHGPRASTNGAVSPGAVSPGGGGGAWGPASLPRTPQPPTLPPGPRVVASLPGNPVLVRHLAPSTDTSGGGGAGDGPSGYALGPGTAAPHDPLGPVGEGSGGGGEEDEVEYIVDHQSQRGRLMYKVHWRGSSSAEDEWFRSDELMLEFPSIVYAYAERVGIDPHGPPSSSSEGL